MKKKSIELLHDRRETIPEGYVKVWLFPWLIVMKNWKFWDWNKREYLPTEFAGWRVGDLPGVIYIRPKVWGWL